MDFKKPDKYTKKVQPRRPPSIPNTPPHANPLPAQSPLAIIKPKTALKTKHIKPRLTSFKQSTWTYIHKLPTSKRAVVSYVIVAIACVAFIGFIIYQNNFTQKNKLSQNTGEVLESLEYQTILPAGKSITDLGGWRRVSPSDSDPVFAFNDMIGSISVSVSEQPLPKSFIGDTDAQVAELAKKFNATNKIDAGGTKVYVGTSAKGPQSAIFTRNGLLILIKSQEKIEDAAWITYVKSLS